MKRSLWIGLALLVLASARAGAHCPITFTLAGPGGASYDILLNGYARTPGDNGTNTHMIGQLGAGLTSGTTVYTFQWDTGGYGWASATLAGASCPTVYFGLQYPDGTDCSEDNLGSAARPSCEPRFVSDGSTCQSYCDDGKQEYPPFLNPLKPGQAFSPRVFPSPLKGAGSVTFANFPPSVTLRVFDFTGRLVKTLMTDSQGAAAWNTVDDAGQLVGSGVYLAIAESGSGAAGRAKFAVQR